MANTLYEDAVPANAGRSILVRSLRKVLIRHGYRGKALEEKIRELQQKDFPRLTAALMSSKSA